MLNKRFATLVMVLSLVLAIGGAAYAEDGAIAIFSANTAGDSITTSVFDHTWDAQTRNDDPFMYTQSGADIEFGETGHYMVMYNSLFTQTATGNQARSEIQSRLSLNGSTLPIGWSQAYIRGDSGVQEAVSSGGGIISVLANQTLQLESPGKIWSN